MTRQKTCKTCGNTFIKEQITADNYIITINRCKCGWKLIDVKDQDGKSLKDLIDKGILEKMIKSKASNLKI
ncbi:MAG: hypothetical protein N2999_06095 [Proteobacteria bacterium]|nr:hypothetical protein [Pseudomonadota bacterium]